MENENLRDRIKEIMDSKHMNNKLFASETGINEGTLSLLLRGKTQPTLKHYEAIHTRFPDIAMEWLFDGKGAMYHSSESSASSDGSSLINAQPSSQVISSQSEPPSSSLNGKGNAASPSHPSLFGQNNYNADSIAHENDKNVVKIFNNRQRKITEIRVFFDDQTWESFVPKK